MSPDTPAAAVQWGTHPRQRTVTATLATLADAIAREGLGAPVITVIGDVVALRDEIALVRAAAAVRQAHRRHARARRRRRR